MNRCKFVSVLGGVLLMLGVVTAAPAGAATTSEIFDASGELFNPCTNESLQVDQRFHLIVSVTDDHAGGQHVHILLNSQYAHAVGLTSGAQYELPLRNTFDDFNVTAGGTVTATVPFGFVWISQGKLPNLKTSAIFHITINPDGTTTALFDKFVFMECQGD